MEFDRSFGPAEFGPVKKGYGKVDDRGIQTAQRILETKFLLSEPLAAAALKQTEKDFLVKLPGAVLIGISQGGTARSSDSQVLQFSLATSETSGYFPEGMGSPELAEEHGDKLPPTAKPFGAAFGSGPLDRLNKFRFGKEL
jgi:hypothetical protein